MCKWRNRPHSSSTYYLASLEVTVLGIIEIYIESRWSGNDEIHFQSFIETRLVCFYVTAILSWGYGWGWAVADIEAKVEVRLTLTWGWFEVNVEFGMKFSWSSGLVEIEIICGWDGVEVEIELKLRLSWGWIQVVLRLGWDWTWVEVELSWAKFIQIDW